MFDTKRVGSRIAALRKAKDMTQMELADQLLVSYQAVSNWERGNSMPDIGKLGDLARILEVSIEELIGSRVETETIHKVMDEGQSLGFEELAGVAPILKPSLVDAAFERTEADEITMESLTSLAPFLSSKRLGEMVDKVRFSNLEELIPVAPFLESQQIGTLINRQQSLSGTMRGLTALAPFMDHEDLGVLVDKIDLKGSLDEVIGVAPFLTQKDVDRLATRCADERVNAHSVLALAPFMSQEGLGMLVKRFSPEGLKHNITALAPFLDAKTLHPIAREFMQSGDLGTLRTLLPFINEEEL